MTGVLPLAGGVNFRDIGGQPVNGGVIRRGIVFRSGRLSHLTVEDRAAVDRLGIRLVCDFRGPAEQTLEPYLWLPQGARLADWGASSSGDVTALRLGIDSTVSDAREAMFDLYRNIAERHADRYSQAIKALAAGEGPAILACTAGKDRTGAAIAIVMGLIGASQDTIVENFALSAKVFDFPGLFHKEAERAENEGRLDSPYLGLVRRVQPDALQAVLASEPDYILTCLNAIDANYGSLRSYAKRRLGLSAENVGALKRFLIE
ncbi:tyrosine-protein phosphatase [Sphingobium sp. V4]|uniref:tyrosine-protein phosphatase n=1 Tax=Sphingobium sp. V4 TaxID=3038927 RepID=UPI0025581D2A|nr:tyrosine-protein phosphatase [Sphingobium sp. V4]WIW89411.1 tyrosine-protein phosphatase [Sphingobium sp. V4]